MPEMPEVEQVRKTLAPHIEGKKILAVEIYLERLIKYPQPDAFIKGLVGKTISSVGRRGKYLVLHTAPKQQLIVHLRMTGALLAQPSAAPAPAYAKIKFTLSDDVTMWFTDIRTFGTLYLVTDNDTYIEGYETLGPEPLSEGFTAAYLLPLAQKSKKAIKSFILDQQIIAGLGNIYADECLALSGILPMRKACSLSTAEVGRLCEAVNAVIAQASKIAVQPSVIIRTAKEIRAITRIICWCMAEAASPVKNAVRCCRQPRSAAEARFIVSIAKSRSGE